MSKSSLTPGRALFTLIGAVTATGPYIADWSYTHVFNPRWPPHAKFHNGQTMSMGLCLGLLTLYSTWRERPYHHSNPGTTAVFGGLYWVTGLSAIFYPGSKAMDPEFGDGSPQLWGFGGILIVDILAWWLESRRS